PWPRPSWATSWSDANGGDPDAVLLRQVAAQAHDAIDQDVAQLGLGQGDQAGADLDADAVRLEKILDDGFEARPFSRQGRGRTSIRGSRGWLRCRPHSPGQPRE